MDFLFVAYALGSWPSWGGGPEHLAVQLTVGAIDTPVVKWAQGSTGPLEWQFSAADDLDGDGVPEVVVGSVDGNVYCFDGLDGSLRWSFSAEDWVHSSPAVADLDGDGVKEVVFGSYDHKVYCLSGADGSEKWEMLTAGSVHSSPTVSDVDGDGKLEVLIGSFDGRVYSLNGSTGVPEWTFITGGSVISSPAVANLDWDAGKEVIVTSRKVYCLSGGSGALKWSADLSTTSSPVIADVDGDGRREVLVTFNSQLVCLSGQDGSTLWSFTALSSSDATPPAAADVDGDGEAELFFSAGRSVYRVEGRTGSLAWSLELPSEAHTPGSLADINGDGRFEFLVPQYTGDTLFCLSADNGILIWKLPLAEDVHTPFVADVDADGCSEVVVGTLSPDPLGRRLFVIDDPRDASECGLSLREGEGRENVSLEGRRLTLFYPKSTWVSARLFDAQGRLVRVLFEGTVQGRQEIPIAPKCSGVHILLVEWDRGRRVFKVWNR